MFDPMITPELGAPAAPFDSPETTSALDAGNRDESGSADDQAASVDWDHKGRVFRSRFSDGHTCQFRYDENGALYGFVYARLAWSSLDGSLWSAQDVSHDYVVHGKICVNVDGTISIETPEFMRTLKLNGTIVDQYV